MQDVSDSNVSYSYRDDIATQAPPFDEKIFYLVQITIGLAMTGVISAFGIVTNIINIAVFYRQGIFSESSTLCLAGLAVSDFFSCFFGFWGCVCLFIGNLVDTSDYEWDVNDFYAMTSQRPKTVFTQLTCLLTAFIAVERFASVVFPFRVKSVFTARRSFYIVCSIFLLTIGMYYPQYTTYIPVWGEHPYNKNKSRLGFVNSHVVTTDMRQIFIILNPLTIRITLIVVVLFCNIAMVWKVKSNLNFRQASKSTSARKSDEGESESNNEKQPRDKTCKPNSKNSKEMRLVRMISLICTVFIICYIPDAFFVSFIFVGAAQLSRNYHWYIDTTAYVCGTLLEIVNASSNIIIYYRINSRYRRILNSCMRWGKKTTPSGEQSTTYASTIEDC